MSSIFERVRNVAMAAFSPSYLSEKTELQYLRQLYDGNGGNVRPNTWYRILNQGGQHVGFSYSCACGMEYQLLQPFEWFRPYTCSQCKNPFELLRAAGVPQNCPPHKFEEHLRKLPVRPRLGGKQQPSAIDTWASGDDGTVTYEPYDPSGK
jgi:hypothetical protein